MNTEALLPTIFGLPGTNEYRAAEQLRNIIAQAALPATTGTTVSIHTNLHFTGQRRGQIDLLMHAHFPSGLTRKVRLEQSSEAIDVIFRDILAVIEVKGHDTDAVNLDGLQALVYYPDSGWEDASEQSHQGAFGAKRFIKNQLHWEPFVCNLIFFSRLLQSNLPTFTPHNYLASDATFDDLLAQLCLARKLNPDSHTSTPLRFSCTYAKDEAVVAEQYTQLRQLLGTHRPELSSPAAPPRMSATQISKPLSNLSSTNNWTTAPPPHRYGYFKRRQIFVLGIVSVCVVSVLTTLYSAKVAQLSQTENPVATVATCRHITSAGDCDAKASFRTGSTVLIQLLGTRQTLVSAHIRDPLGNSSTLTFRNQPPNAKQIAKSYLVAKYVLSRHAPPGSYAIQVTVQGEGKKAEQPLTSSFDVTR
jgi:hypothetical protein